MTNSGSEYRVALAPDLGISAADFIAAWNSLPQAHALAAAEPDTSSGAQFGGMPDLLVVLGTLAGGIASNALYDVIKQIIISRTGKQHLQVADVEQPDGSRLLVVDEDEGVS